MEKILREERGGGKQTNGRGKGKVKKRRALCLATSNWMIPLIAP